MIDINVGKIMMVTSIGNWDRRIGHEEQQEDLVARSGTGM
jgi:hypothetical protein